MYGKDRDGIGRPVLVNSEGMPIMQSNLADAAKEGRLFSVANQAAVACTAALATTWTGLGVGNPTSSGKLYVIHEFGWSQSVIGPDDAAFGLMLGTIGNMAQAIAPMCARLGYKTSNALADDGATIGTPVLARLVGSSMEGAISTIPSLSPNIYKVNGSIVVPAGQAVLTYATKALTAAYVFHFVWEEIDA